MYLLNFSKKIDCSLILDSINEINKKYIFNIFEIKRRNDFYCDFTISDKKFLHLSFQNRNLFFNFSDSVSECYYFYDYLMLIVCYHLSIKYSCKIFDKSDFTWVDLQKPTLIDLESFISYLKFKFNDKRKLKTITRYYLDSINHLPKEFSPFYGKMSAFI